MKKGEATRTGPASAPAEELNLADDVEGFMRDSKKIRRVLEEVGRTKVGPVGALINALFVVALILLILARFVFGWLDNILSLEIGVLLVSAKIIWMMRVQERYNHFMFWILHSIEFRQNLLLKKLDDTVEDGKKKNKK